MCVLYTHVHVCAGKMTVRGGGKEAGGRGEEGGREGGGEGSRRKVGGGEVERGRQEEEEREAGRVGSTVDTCRGNSTSHP